ncbi:hypothetical protein CVS30_06465 [Arthrobacter psychrolactophilus]|uniref:Alkaline shock response membrane anchor protein AmaP n=1 Tax=Arthrobacter psychrolactophilus TaxID=92442 RepID=A0A2V5IXD4_9MICC|nr:hypothetical protein [Arthrobacter psychrolactophilus]PYI38953.1 hypothetical protein CVS30_06465 [Arthrobacter psychrolactophilus]
MNGTHRGLNRTLLGLIGLVLIASGASSVLAGTSRGFAQRWTNGGTGLWAGIQERLDAARIPGTETSWWTLAALALLVIVAVLLVCWIASQGTGRSNHVARLEGNDGETVVDTAVAAQAIKAALSGNPQVLATSVQSWRTKGAGQGTGLKISVQTRKGASPAEVSDAVEHVVESLDHLLGVQLPVLVRIRAGARSKFARTQRVA